MQIYSVEPNHDLLEIVFTFQIQKLSLLIITRKSYFINHSINTKQALELKDYEKLLADFNY